MIFVYEAFFGIRRRTCMEVEDGTKPGDLTLLKAKELRREWRTGLKRFHPKTIQIDEPDPWE
jgi:hypothetical protein